MSENILYYQIASIPIFVILIIATLSKSMIKGRSNKLLLLIICTAFTAAVSDLFGNLVATSFPLTQLQVKLIAIINYIYFPARSGMNAFYIFYLFSVTRTWYRIKASWKKIIILLPYIGTLIILLFNEQTGAVFYVTRETGYERGPHILIIYGLAAIYMAFGMIYLVICRKLLNLAEGLSIASMYVLNIVGVIIQYFDSRYLVECFFTSMTLLFVVLFVQKPEKQIDMNTRLPGYFAFREEMGKIQITGQRVQVIVAYISNASDLLRYLGENIFFEYVHSMEKAVASYAKKEKIQYDLYFRSPGYFYLIIEDLDYNPVQAISTIREKVRKKSGNIAATGARIDLKVVSIRFPEDFNNTEELFKFCHTFARFDRGKIYYHASQILELREYQIETNLEEILNRAIDEQKLEVCYSPVWSVSQNRPVFAAAYAKINDVVFGEISGEILEDALKARGTNLILEEYVMEQVFAFVGGGNLASSGYEFIVLGLSNTMGMQKNLTDRIWNLRGKYKVNPDQICFAIKDSAYDNMSEGFDDNIRKLALQGYKLALDGYGNGYTNIKHLVELPLSNVRLDKSLVEEGSTESGRALLMGTIQMLENIPLTVVASGIKDEATKNMLVMMGCDLMHGEYFSKIRITDKEVRSEENTNSR